MAKNDKKKRAEDEARTLASFGAASNLGMTRTPIGAETLASGQYGGTGGSMIPEETTRIQDIINRLEPGIREELLRMPYGAAKQYLIDKGYLNSDT